MQRYVHRRLAECVVLHYANSAMSGRCSFCEVGGTQSATKTNHHRLFSKTIEGSEDIPDYGDIYWTNMYELLECAGCESVTLRHTYYFQDTDETTIRTYPPRIARRRPRWMNKLPKPMREMLRQAYVALDSNCPALTTMGARAVLDMLLVEQVGDVGGFGKKLKALEESGVVGQKNRLILETALDAGSAAAHRGHQAAADDVNAVMDILENLLQAVYQLDSLADRLRRTTPPREESV